MRVSVFPDKFIKAWGERGRTEDVDVAYVTPTALAEALSTDYPTDAHAVGYVLLGGDEDFTPRVHKDALRDPFVQGALRMCVGFIDLDRPAAPGTTGHPPWADPADAHAAVATLAALFPRCAVFSTRAGARLVYVLPEPATIPAYIPYARAVLSQVQGIISASGLALDVDGTTTQWTRMFRMPRVVRDGKATASEAYFAARIPPDIGPLPLSPIANPTAASVAPGRSVSEVGEGADDVDRPAPGTGLSDEDWDDVTSTLGPRMALRGHGGLLAALRAGTPFYAPGERNSATYRAIATLLDAARSVPLDAEGLAYALPADAVYLMFEASTAATKGHTAPEDALDELWDITRRLCEASEYAEVETGHVRLPQKLALYTPPDGTPPVEVPLVVYGVGNGRYLWTPAGRYTAAISNNDSFRATFAHYWGHLYGKPGPVADVLTAYGTPVDEVFLDLGATHPSVETTPMGTALVLPMARRTDIAPEYDPDVDAWLRHIAGSDLDGVLDWLYWYPHLRENVCALFLCGAPGTGKSMLGSALAVAYGGEFVQFDKAVGTFTGQLRKTPLVWLDEGTKAKDAIDAFRRLVGNDRTQIERKHVDPETIRGCFRMLVTANKPSALPLDDIRSLYDVESIQERVRYVHVSEIAAEWLRAKGGREFTEGWVTRADGSPGRLPGHIAWIQANRTPCVTPGSRFKVQGIPTPWHYRALYNGDVGVVLALVASQVVRATAASCVQYDRDNDRILVAPNAFLHVAAGALRNDGVETSDARAVLKALAEGDILGPDGETYLTLPTKLLRSIPATELREKDTAAKLHALFQKAAP